MLEKKTYTMKNMMLIILLMITSTINLSAQKTDTTKTVLISDIEYTKMGLLAKLAYVKISAENYMTNFTALMEAQVSDTAKCDARCKEAWLNASRQALKNYQILQVEQNALIFQLMGHMALKQKPAAYRKLDKYLANEKKSINGRESVFYASLARASFALNDLYKTPLPSQSTSSTLGGGFDPTSLIPSVTDLMGVTNDIITAAQEHQKNKVDGLNTILNTLQITPATALLKKGE